ncbi:hypothetical protein B0H13DRAFT_2290545 [Mycena leptocephala]|nr:hypothetical protein B0H13DRAFT_2290545 [Mycena leptocephala]
MSFEWEGEGFMHFFRAPSSTQTRSSIPLPIADNTTAMETVPTDSVDDPLLTVGWTVQERGVLDGLNPVLKNPSTRDPIPFVSDVLWYQGIFWALFAPRRGRGTECTFHHFGKHHRMVQERGSGVGCRIRKVPSDSSHSKLRTSGSTLSPKLRGVDFTGPEHLVDREINTYPLSGARARHGIPTPSTAFRDPVDTACKTRVDLTLGNIACQRRICRVCTTWVNVLPTYHKQVEGNLKVNFLAGFIATNENMAQILNFKDVFLILKGFFRTTSIRGWPPRSSGTTFRQPVRRGPTVSPDSLDGDHRTTFTTGSLFSRVPSLPALSTVNTRPYKQPLNKHQGPTLIIQLKGTVAFLGRPSAQCGQSSIFESNTQVDYPRKPWHTAHIDAMDAATSAQDQIGDA